MYKNIFLYILYIFELWNQIQLKSTLKLNNVENISIKLIDTPKFISSLNCTRRLAIDKVGVGVLEEQLVTERK